jgi:chitinase
MRTRRLVALGSVLLVSVGGLAVALAPTAGAAPVRYEAENAVLSGAVVANNKTGYTGTGFADYNAAAGTYVEWTVNAASAGTHSLAFRFANGSTANRPMNIRVNGTSIASAQAFNPTGAWETWTTVTLNATLAAGSNKVRATANLSTGGPNVDSLTVDTVAASSKKVIGYFAQWDVYRGYHVKNIDTSGSAAKLTHIMYAFGNVQNGQCVIGDAEADYQRTYTAAESVDGVADSSTQALKGNFNQLRKLKLKHPQLKIIWSFGGWTWSGGFGQAAANPTTFANSCYNLVEDSRWASVFDGIDIDWEYPNSCGLSCDTSGFSAYKNLMSALRTRFGTGNLVTSAITADGTSGGKIDAADYAGAAQYVDWYMPMTYDYFGAWDGDGPTAPHSPLNSYTGIPQAGFYSDAAIQKLKSKGIPSSKLLLGIGFYGRGWTGVTQSTPGGSATGPAPGIEPGIQDYKVLKTQCPSNGTVAGTAYAYCSGQWWSYDTPATVTSKMTYAKNQGLAGAFFWEISGDTSNGELVTAIKNGLG